MKHFKHGCLALAISCIFAPLHLGASSPAVPDNITVSASTRQATNDGIIPARQFILDQPGTPHGLRISQQRVYDQTPLQSTGFWVKKGDVLNITVTLPANVSAPYLEAFISVPHDRTYQYTHAQRQQVKAGNNTVRVDQDGILYIAHYTDAIAGDIKIDIQGGQPFPRFILKQNTPDDWNRMLADAEMQASPYVELLSDRMMITLRRSIAEQSITAADVSDMLATWDKIVTWTEDQYGITESDPKSKHRRISHRFHFVDGVPPQGVVNNDTCYGALNSWTWRLQACYDDAMRTVVHGPGMAQNGWGPWHELGHQFQMEGQKWDGMGEVSVNLTSLYVQRELGARSRLEAAGDWYKAFTYFKQAERDYHSQDLFVKVAMLWQLDLTFGKDFYAKLGRIYRDMTTFPDKHGEKIQRFILETSKLAGYNLVPFYDQWGLPADAATRQTLDQLALPLMKDPIWENRDEDIKYDYSQSQDQAPLAVAGANFTVKATSDASRAYALDGSASKNAVKFKWDMVKGGGTFYLQNENGGEWQWVVNTAKARALIPKDRSGEVTYRLTVWDKYEREASSLITVTVEEQPAVNQDAAFITGAVLNVTPKDNGDTITYNGVVTSGTSSTSAPSYTWTVPQGSSSGKAQQSFTLSKQAQVQNLNVSVVVKAGTQSRTLSQKIVVPAKEQPVSGVAAWDASKTYILCDKVSYNGKVWVSGWWTRGDIPTNSGNWGVWRLAGVDNMHAGCK